MLLHLINEEILSTENLENIKGGSIIEDESDFLVGVTFIIEEDGDF